MSDSETALAVAAAIAALREDDDEEMTQAVDGVAGGADAGTMPEGSEETAGVLKQEEPQPVVPPKPKTKVLSCLICTKPVTLDNTQLGSSNPSDEYERMMRVACKLLCVDSNPSLKRWQFRHSDEPKKLCCDECCEVIFNLGSLQSIIDRTKLAINKKLDWILRTVSDSEAEQSDEIEKVFFGGRSEVFRKEVLEVCKRRKNAGATNGLCGDSDDEEEELVNKGVQTDVSGESGVSDLPTKAGRKFYDDLPSYTFDDSNNMDTYSDHNNDDFNYNSTFDNNDDSTYSTPKPEPQKRSYNKKSTTPASATNNKQTNNRRGRPSTSATKRSAKFDESDDEIEILEEKKSNKQKSRAPPAKSSKLDARELVKVEYSGDTGRPKRSAAAKRPNYQMLAGDDDDDYTTSYKRQSVSSTSGSDLSKQRKPPPRKDVTLSAIPIVKDASGKTYFEGVEIVRTDKSITCKHLNCQYVVDGAGYNAFERIKAHIHESHVEDSLPDIY